MADKQDHAAAPAGGSNGSAMPAGSAAAGGAEVMASPADAPTAAATATASAPTAFPFLGTPLATVILDWVPQKELGPVRLACRGLLDATRALTFSGHPVPHTTKGKPRGPSADTSLLTVGERGLTVERYCTLFPSALKVDVRTPSLTLVDASALHRFFDITLRPPHRRRCRLREDVLVMLASRGPASPPLRRLTLVQCKGLTGAAFATMATLQELVLRKVDLTPRGLLRLPPTLTRFVFDDRFDIQTDSQSDSDHSEPDFGHDTDFGHDSDGEDEEESSTWGPVVQARGMLEELAELEGRVYVPEQPAARPAGAWGRFHDLAEGEHYDRSRIRELEEPFDGVDYGPLAALRAAQPAAQAAAQAAAPAVRSELSLSMVADCRSLRHLEWNVEQATSDPGFDLAAACPALETLTLRVTRSWQSPGGPRRDLALGLLPAVSWAGLPRLQKLQLHLEDSLDAPDAPDAVMDGWLTGLKGCGGLEELSLCVRGRLLLTSLASLPPSVRTLVVSGGGVRLCRHGFSPAALGQLRKLTWIQRTGTTAEFECGLADACPGLEELDLRLVASPDHPLKGLPLIPWGRMTGLRDLRVTINVHAVGSDQPDLQVIAGWMSGLPASLEVLRMTATGFQFTAPVLTDADIADLPQLRALELQGVQGLTGAQPANLPALETLHMVHRRGSLRSLTFVSTCTRLREVGLSGCHNLPPEALAALPDSVEELTVARCRRITEEQAQAICPQVRTLTWVGMPQREVERELRSVFGHLTMD